MSEDLEVGITLIANDQASGTISTVKESLGEMSSAVRENMAPINAEREALMSRRKEIMRTVKEERLFRTSFRQQHELFFTSTRLIGQVGNAGLKLNSIFLGYNVLQERIANADERVADARRRLAEATEKYGANSKKAKDAQEDLTKELKAQEKVAREVPGQYLAMGTAAFSLAGDIGLIAQSVATLGFQLRSRGGLSKIFGRGGGKITAAAGGGAAAATSTAAGVGGASLLARAGPPGLVLAAGTLALEQIQNLLPKQFHPVLQAFSPVLLAEKLLGGTQISDLLGINELLGTKPAAEGGGGGDTIIVQDDVNVSGTSAASMRGIMDDLKRRTRVQQRIGGNSS